MKPIIKLTSWMLMFLLVNVHISQGLRIIGLFPMQGKSHFVIVERLMIGLAEKGHKVDVYSHFPLKKPLPNYTDFSLAGSMPSLMNNMSYDYFKSFSHGSSIDRIIDLIGNPVCDLLNLPIFQKLIHDPPKDPPYDLLIIESFISDCYLAFGRHLKVPVVTVVSTGLFDWWNSPLGNPTNLAIEPSVFSPYMVPMTFFERVHNVYSSYHTSWKFHSCMPYQNALVKKHFGSDFPSISEMQKDISLVLVNYHHALNGIRVFTPAIVPVGGLHIVDRGDKLPQEVQKFLDESKHGFIYVSFGSMVRIETFPKPALDAFYKTFKNIAPIRVLMKIAKPEELPPGLPSNVITNSWLPQVKVLQHKNIKAFVTHGGLMGTQEAIYYGVPLIGFPLFGDQYFNIRSYAKKNIAIELNRHNITEESFTQAIKQIINNPLYKDSAQKISKAFKDAPMSPMDTAAYWIEYINRQGKYALRSPVVDMPWWQASLLDVYGFIALVVTIVLFVVVVILKKLIRVLIPKETQHLNSKLKKN